MILAYIRPFILVIGALTVGFPPSVKAQSFKTNDPQTSLSPAAYTALPLGAIRPKAWLLHQLQIMNEGASGHLDEVYAKVKNDNGWLGGKGDGWEETPYWLDGALPLAYLLDDARLKQKVQHYIDWTLDHQRPSGYFGPLTAWERKTGKQVSADSCGAGDDWWPRMIMLKVLQQYYTATNDKRVIPFMTRYFQYQLKTIRQCPLSRWTDWASSRGADNALIAQWLYTQTGQKELLELAAILQQQAIPWSQLLLGRDWVITAAAYQDNDNWMTRHGVNVGMGLKDPAVQYQRTSDSLYLKALYTGFRDLMSLHGLPFGMFSADEDLHGNAPEQGTELCATVEAMFSLENIIGITGDTRFMDALERMAFNALPGQTTDDYNNKQYFQMANQLRIAKGVFDFSLPFEREMTNVLGMRSGYTCCLANMHQGWTKFTSHLWYATPNHGLAALHYSPNEVKSRVGAGNTAVTIREETNYPFDDNIRFLLQTRDAVEFPWQLRIPAWCKEAVISVNGKELQREQGGRMVTINRKWHNGDRLELKLPMTITVSEWGRNTRAVERGPLVYALKLKENWKKQQDEVEGEYFSVSTNDTWNYGLLQKAVTDPQTQMTVAQTQPVKDDFIWNLAHAPLEIKVPAKQITRWQLTAGSQELAPVPVSSREGLYRGPTEPTVTNITLVPIGCTKVRIVAFPVVR
ncbi:glycoside hydrolase family 127 protein [Chitinophaga pendula]|nr:hypothetical protein CK934_21955 [Chitinophaga sp. MD30]UCJ10219.1 glycoside hydrolase family 127 protein [Chitinophaga pendula]